VKKIGQIRRHHETTLFERHASAAVPLFLSDPKIAKLEKLCDKLAGFASPGRSTEKYASQEITRLSVADPFVRSLLIDRRISSSIIWDHDHDVVASRVNVPNGILDLHSLWSDLLRISQDSESASRPSLSEYLQTNQFLLMNTLRKPGLSFLAARYLCHVLTLELAGGDLYYLARIWHSYIYVIEQEVNNRPESILTIEWTNLNICFENIALARRSVIVFLPTNRLLKFASFLIRLGLDSRVPSIFSTFLSSPRVDFGDLGVLLSYHTRVLTLLNTSNDGTAQHLERQIFRQCSNDKLWLEYCELVNLESEGGVPSLIRFRPRGDLLVNAVKVSQPYYERSRSRALFFLASFIGIDRYNRLGMSNDHDFRLSSQFVEDVRNLVGPSKYTTLALFDNAPYLRRFRVNGRLFITSIQLPEPPNVLIKNFVLRDFAVDTMVLTGNTVLWLPVDGYQSPFNVTGHYPILAGYKENQPLYVAAVKFDNDYYFTVVKDGASTVRYINGDGKKRETHKFVVLALRYDPSDLMPPYPHASASAMDPTGPLHWLKFWPEMDPGYSAASDISREDDRRLVSFFGNYARSGNTELDV